MAGLSAVTSSPTSVRQRKPGKPPPSPSPAPTSAADIPLAAPPRGPAPRKPLVTLEDAQAEALQRAGLVDGADGGGSDGSEDNEAGDGRAGAEDDVEGEGGGEDEGTDGAEWDEFFDSLQLTVPFCFLYLMMDILTNLSYSRHPAWTHYAQNMLTSVPTIGMIIFYSTRYLHLPPVRVLLLATSIAAGTRLIWLVNKAPYLLVMGQAPAVGTLWIITVVQLPLQHVAAALAVVFAWSWWAKMKFRP
ncbi:hypothetical protein Q5752_003718 [Cryptotrichosporon argae]